MYKFGDPWRVIAYDVGGCIVAGNNVVARRNRQTACWESNHESDHHKPTNRAVTFEPPGRVIVSLKTEDNRNISFPRSILSKTDQACIEEKAKMMARALTVFPWLHGASQSTNKPTFYTGKTVFLRRLASSIWMEELNFRDAAQKDLTADELAIDDDA